MILKFRNSLMLWLFFSSGFLVGMAQETALKGFIIDDHSERPLEGVLARLDGLPFQCLTNVDGMFAFQDSLPLGEQLLILSKSGYVDMRLPIVLNENTPLILEQLSLRHDFSSTQLTIGVINLSEEAFDDDAETGSDASGLLQASKDVFLKAAAYDWSSTFFRPRGYDSSQGKVLINGVEMNKVYSGRPQWSNWGGLNEVIRNQEFSRNTEASDAAFGGIAGTTAIHMRASKYRRGGQLSYGLSNRSYVGRVMGTYHSGNLENGWAYSLSLSRRYGAQGFIAGTLYDANAIFGAVEKQLGAQHSISLVAFYTPNIRGKTAPNTQEVLDLKGTTYNPYWGYQNGAIRNSRVRRIEEPVAILNHFWKWNDNRMQLQNTLGVQIGSVGNSRLHYGGTKLVTSSNDQTFFVGNGSNPDPTYYQRLPSYFLRFPDQPDYEKAYLATQELQNNGQLDWDALYQANQSAKNQGGLANYVVYEDRSDDTQLTASSTFRGVLTNHITLNAGLNFKSLHSENYAAISDLLGGNGFLDIDSFAEGNAAQSDLQNPNNIVGLGDRFQYDYNLTARIGQVFAQGQFKYHRLNFFLSGTASQTYYKRNGNFENGNASGSASFGESEPIVFSNVGFKGGMTFKWSPKHFLQLNALYQNEAPTLRTTFSNVRQENTAVFGIKSQQTRHLDLGYLLQTSKVKARVSSYYTEINDATNLGFFYTDALANLGVENTAAFVQELLTGISKRHMGLEFGIEVPLHTTFKLKAAAAIGEHIYDNNPELYLTSNNFATPQQLGESVLQNYHVPGGPQQAYSFGFEYNDPNYWWLSCTANYFSNAYVSVSPFARTKNFYTDTDGLPFSNYDAARAKTLLKQEKFDPYLLVNAVGGKSWRIKKYYVGFLAGVNNVLNTAYKTGGFEQARNANYQGLQEESKRENPVFGTKYWQGLGTTFFTNFYIRF